MKLKVNVIKICQWIFVFAGVLIAIPFAYGQETTIEGQVLDQPTGETLPGVNVIIKGTTTGTTTDAEGGFSLNVPSLQDTLVFSYVGYQTREVPIDGREQIEVSLQPQAITGEEMVVVGYGTQRRQDITGSISSVSSDDFNTGVALAPEQLMQGIVAGVSIVESNGAHGAASEVRIRW